jgi:hypothetical protein
MTTIIVLPAKVVSDNDPVGTYNAADRGSDRGSGYWFSNAILRHCDKLFATWQGYDPNTGKFTVWVGTNQLGTSTWSTPVALTDPALVSGQTMDNHGMASIIADSDGYLHLLYGPHHGPMLEAVSNNPWDASAFRWPQIINTAPWNLTTYSSMVRDSTGMLHFVYRGENSSGEWRVIYQNGTTNGTGTTTWGTPQPLASTANGTSDTTGYSDYDATIAVGAHDSLHVAYMMYKYTTGAARSWGYLRSNDRGQNWQDANGVNVTASLPIDNSTLNSSHRVESSPIMDVRVCNIAIDPIHREPWISVCYLAPPGRPMLGGYDTRLWRLTGGQWSVISLSPFILNSFGTNWRVALATITFDNQGVLYVAADRVDINDLTADAWFAGKSKEVMLLVSTDLGQTFQVYPISSANSLRTRWLANIERPTTAAPIPVPSLLYTDCPATNVSTGGTAKPSDIVFVPLYKN